MQNNDDSNSGSTPLGLATHNKCGNLPSPDLHLHLENQDNPQLSSPDGTDAPLFGNSTAEANPQLLNINAISNADSHVIHMDSRPRDSPKKEHLSRTESSHDQCRYALPTLSLLTPIYSLYFPILSRACLAMNLKYIVHRALLIIIVLRLLVSVMHYML